MTLYELIELKRVCLEKGCELLIDDVNYNISLFGPRKGRAAVVNWLKAQLQPTRTLTQLNLSRKASKSEQLMLLPEADKKAR
jgi:hypothetical protein